MTSAAPAGLFFATGGVRVELEGGSEQRRSALLELWFRLFVEDVAPPSGPGVRVKLRAAPQVVPSGEVVYAGGTLRVLKTVAGFSLHCGASSLEVAPRPGTANCYLDETFEAHTPYEQREFFLLGLLMLLRPRGLYGLHACGLRRGKTGLLLVGPSGAGKTTTTLNLMRSGWACLSDDAVLLRRGDGVEALAFRRGFSCTPKTLRALGVPEAAPEPGDPSGKRQVAGEAYGDFATACRPGLLLFPRLTVGETRLEPVPQAKALINLCRHSAGIMTDRAVSREQLELLKTLASSAKSFDLALGTDALDDPGLVSSLIGGVA